MSAFSDLVNCDSDPYYVPVSDNESDKDCSRPGPSNVNKTDSTGGVSSQAEAECSSRPKGVDCVGKVNSTILKGKGRKRKRDATKWKRNVLKKKRASGEELIKPTAAVVSARSTGTDCNCKFKCFTVVTDNIKTDIINSFNAMADKEKQDIHLSGLISLSTVQRRRPKTGDGQNRAYAAHYKVKHGTFDQKVCKKAFCSLYGIGKRRVERLVGYLQEGIPVLMDKRGKHGNRPNKIPDNIINQIDEHIQSFPAQVSHYSRNKNVNVRYLSPDLSIQQMHRLYLKKYETEVFSKIETGEESKPTVSYDFYNRHFNQNYKLSFGTPKTDTCQKCDQFENRIKFEKNPESLTTLQLEKELHQRKSEEFYKEMNSKIKESKTNDMIEVLTFDFQQNLPLPVVPSGDVFYKRQLWCYNFTIYCASNGKSYCYMYNESTGKKGQNEVISMINHFITNEISPSVKQLYLFSDNCSAQNKNIALMQYFYTLVKGYRRFDKIVHRYPEPGHSFLPCDRSFGIIEKERRKRERVFLPKDYEDMVKKTSKKFVVVQAKQSMFLDFTTHFKGKFKTLQTLYAKPQNVNEKNTPKKPTKGSKFTISKYRYVEYNKDIMLCSSSAAVVPSVKEAFLLEKPNITFSLPEYGNVLHHGPLKIKKKKFKDVKELVEKYVPPDCLWFYNELIQEDDAKSNTSDAEDGDYDD